MTRRTQKEPNENGIGRGRIRHTPKGDLQHKCRRGSGPPLEPVVMSHDWGAIRKRDKARSGIATSTGQRFGEEARRARVKTKLRESYIKVKREQIAEPSSSGYLFARSDMGVNGDKN